MTDRELLEMAAKAAGLAVQPNGRTDGAFIVITNDDGDYIWSPLTDDGDALRLAVKLGLDIMTRRAHGGAYAGTPEQGASASAEDDPYAATRRAIVRAAAEIGRAKEWHAAT